MSPKIGVWSLIWLPKFLQMPSHFVYEIKSKFLLWFTRSSVCLSSLISCDLPAPLLCVVVGSGATCSSLYKTCSWKPLCLCMFYSFCPHSLPTHSPLYQSGSFRSWLGIVCVTCSSNSMTYCFFHSSLLAHHINIVYTVSVSSTNFQSPLSGMIHYCLPLQSYIMLA